MAGMIPAESNAGKRQGQWPWTGLFQEPPAPSGWATEKTTTSNRQGAKVAKNNNTLSSRWNNKSVVSVFLGALGVLAVQTVVSVS